MPRSPQSNPVTFKQGHIYRIRTLNPPARLPREHVLSYLGEDRYGGTMWNARPFAGTQAISRDSIIEIEDLGVTGGRDDRRHTMNKVVRG